MTSTRIIISARIADLLTNNFVTVKPHEFSIDNENMELSMEFRFTPETEKVVMNRVRSALRMIRRGSFNKLVYSENFDYVIDCSIQYFDWYAGKVVKV